MMQFRPTSWIEKDLKLKYILKYHIAYSSSFYKLLNIPSNVKKIIIHELNIFFPQIFYNILQYKMNETNDSPSFTAN